MKKLMTGAGVLALAAALLIGFLFFQAWLFLRLPGGSERAMIVVDVPPRTNAMSVAQLLQEKHLISDAQKFYLLCRYRKAASRLRAGEYGFLSPTTPDLVLDKLVQGRVLLHRVTFPEGATLWDVSRVLEEQGLVSAQEFTRIARDPELMHTLGINGPSLEGYLFPETYHFPKSQEVQTILRTMVQQFRQHFPDAWVKRSEEIGMRVQDVVTLASIVEKEAAVDSDRAIIASVFHNRLKKNMPLQSDPTSVYDLPGFSGPVMSAHLKRQSPYNTYLIRGLPVGPICNPGRKSLEAVLYPETTSFLYFVSNLDGTHRFSATNAEHQHAVGQYREKVRAAHDQAKTQPGEVGVQGGSEVEKPEGKDHE
jgi:UPF0755 protein